MGFKRGDRVQDNATGWQGTVDQTFHDGSAAVTWDPKPNGKSHRDTATEHDTTVVTDDNK